MNRTSIAVRMSLVLGLMVVGCSSEANPGDGDDGVIADGGADPVTPQDSGAEPDPQIDSGTDTPDMDAGTDESVDVDGGTDESVDVDGGDEMACADTGETYLFVATWLDVAGVEDGVSKGYNLDSVDNRPAAEGGDGRSSASCNRDDFTSPSGEPGIDNQAGYAVSELSGSVINFDIGETALASINEGQLVVLLEVKNVDDLTNDDCVTVNLLFGDWTGDSAPTLDGERLAGGQTFAIRSDSYDEDGNPIVSVVTSIASGSVLAGPVNLTVEVPFGMAGDVELAIDMGMIGFDLTDPGDGVIAENGSIGGSVDNAALAAALEPYVGGDYTSLLGLLYADMERTSAGSCNAMSAVLEFETIDAVRGELLTATTTEE